MLAESLKPNDFIVISGRRMAGRYMSRPAMLSDRDFIIESAVPLFIVLPQRGQMLECPPGASIRGNNRSQSGQARRWSKFSDVGCKATS